MRMDSSRRAGTSRARQRLSFRYQTMLMKGLRQAPNPVRLLPGQVHQALAQDGCRVQVPMMLSDGEHYLSSP